jgi:shikimate kinase
MLVIMKKESIVLIGMAGAGKSTVGAALAGVLGFEFTDLDDYIRGKEGRSIQAIIDTRGEEYLLALEERYIYEIDLKRRVVAPGGSVIYSPTLMSYLKQQAVLVYLDESFENLEKRLKNASTRGIVGLKNKTLREIFDERKPLYSGYADISLTTAGKSQDQVVNEIASIIHNLKY